MCRFITLLKGDPERNKRAEIEIRRCWDTSSVLLFDFPLVRPGWIQAKVMHRVDANDKIRLIVELHDGMSFQFVLDRKDKRIKPFPEDIEDVARAD